MRGVRHLGPEGLLATVVRHKACIQRGAGGLVLANTDWVAQALKSTSKVPIAKCRPLHCAVPYALEGLLCRKIETSGGALLSVQHASAIECSFSMAATAADALIGYLNAAGLGLIAW